MELMKELDSELKLTEEQITFFKVNGYLHLKNFFSEKLVDEFRAGCYRAAKDPSYKMDASGIPEFQLFPLRKKVISVVSQLLDCSAVQYPGLSQTRADDFARGKGYQWFNHNRGWHVDSHPDDMRYEKDYPVINTGVYLQNHEDFSGGLKVWPGSHKTPCFSYLNFKSYFKSLVADFVKLRWVSLLFKLRPSTPRNIPSRSNDLIIWSMRLHHSGFAVRPKFFRNIALPPIVDNWIPKWAARPPEKDRCVLITAYGKPCALFDKYMDTQARKAKRDDYYRNSPLGLPSVMEIAKSNGVVLRNDSFEYCAASDARAIL